MRRWSIFFAIREIKIKIIMKYHFIPISMAMIIIIIRKTGVGKHVEKLECSYIVCGNVKQFSCCGEQSDVSSKS